MVVELRAQDDRSGKTASIRNVLLPLGCLITSILLFYKYICNNINRLRCLITDIMSTSMVIEQVRE
jgi:hypothetical protein